MAFATRDQVGDFIDELRSRFKEAGGITFVRRWELNCEASSELGRTNAVSEILALTVGDYSQGPEPDKTGTGEVWIFGKEIGGVEYYIKLKITSVGEEPVCLSFHEKKRAIVYPYGRASSTPEVDAEQ